MTIHGKHIKEGENMKRVAFYYDKKHFGNSVSIFDNTEWYLIVIKDREHYGYSALTKDRKKYYNIDSQIKKIGFEFQDTEGIQEDVVLDFENVFYTECPDYILKLLDTGELFEDSVRKNSLTRRLIETKYSIWLIAGFLWAFFMYVSEYGFTLNIRWEFILLYLLGGLLWGLLTGFLFNIDYHRKSYDTEKYKSLLTKRLDKGRKFNRTPKEYNIHINIRTLENLKDFWDIMVKKIINLESEGIVLVSKDGWYNEITEVLKSVIEDKTISYEYFNHYLEIINEYEKFDKMQINKLGIIQIDILLNRMTFLIESYVVLEKEHVDQFEVLLVYYYYSLKLGILDQDEFNEFLNKETMKDDVKDITIDLQFASNKSVNEMIEVLFKYFEIEERLPRVCVMNLIARGLSYRAIQLYKDNLKSQDEYLDIMYSLYRHFRFLTELHVFDNYEYYPELDGFEQGLTRQEDFAINLLEFLSGEN